MTRSGHRVSAGVALAFAAAALAGILAVVLTPRLPRTLGVGAPQPSPAP